MNNKTKDQFGCKEEPNIEDHEKHEDVNDLKISKKQLQKFTVFMENPKTLKKESHELVDDKIDQELTITERELEDFVVEKEPNINE